MIKNACIFSEPIHSKPKMLFNFDIYVNKKKLATKLRRSIFNCRQQSFVLVNWLPEQVVTTNQKNLNKRWATFLEKSKTCCLTSPPNIFWAAVSENSYTYVDKTLEAQLKQYQLEIINMKKKEKKQSKEKGTNQRNRFWREKFENRWRFIRSGVRGFALIKLKTQFNCNQTIFSKEWEPTNRLKQNNGWSCETKFRNNSSIKSMGDFNITQSSGAQECSGLRALLWTEKPKSENLWSLKNVLGTSKERKTKIKLTAMSPFKASLVLTRLEGGPAFLRIHATISEAVRPPPNSVGTPGKTVTKIIMEFLLRIYRSWSTLESDNHWHRILQLFLDWL